MGVQGFAARSALVLRRALTERSPVRTGYTDGHALAALQFRGVRRLIIVPRVRSYIIGITFLVVVELRESGVKPGFERVQVHRVGIEHLFIDDLFPVPAFLHMDFVGVCLLRLFAAPADDIAVLPVVDTIGIAVVLVVELLYPASRPTGIPFRIGERLLPLRGIGIEVGIGCLETRPFAAVQYAVIVRRRVVVAQGDTPLLAPGDIPPLRVVVSRRLVQIVRHPGGKVVVAEIEQSRHVVLTAHHVNQQAAEVMLRLLEERTVMVIQVNDLADPAAHQLVERTGLQQGVADIPDTCRGETDAHVVEVVDVVLQVLLGEIARHAGDVVQHVLPVDVAYLREFQ